MDGGKISEDINLQSSKEERDRSGQAGREWEDREILLIGSREKGGGHYDFRGGEEGDRIQRRRSAG